MRSKSLLVSNILSTLYSGGLLWIFGGAIIKAGGADFVEALGAYFELVFSLAGVDNTVGTTLYVIVILLCIHILAFVLGTTLSWISYSVKKSAPAKISATLFLIATIAFPVFILFALPITIFEFVGAKNQKKLNKVTA